MRQSTALLAALIIRLAPDVPDLPRFALDTAKRWIDVASKYSAREWVEVAVYDPAHAMSLEEDGISPTKYREYIESINPLEHKAIIETRLKIALRANHTKVSHAS